MFKSGCTNREHERIRCFNEAASLNVPRVSRALNLELRENLLQEEADLAGCLVAHIVLQKAFGKGGLLRRYILRSLLASFAVAEFYFLYLLWPKY